MPVTNEEAFVTDNLPYAQKVQDKYGIPVKVTLSQAAAESNWGKSVVGNNLFGIKGTGTNTTDAQTGAAISQRKYDSKEHSFDDYGKFLTENKRYQPAFQHADTPEKFADAVASAGYSEKPEEYKQLLKGTMAKVDEVMGGKSEPKQQGGLTISPAASDLLQQTGNNPNEYLKKINADIAKGGEFKDKAYRSFYDLENKAMPLGQRTLQTFVSAAAKAPINQTDNSWWQDVAGATKNGINKGWAHFQEAFVAGKEAVGIDTSEEAKKRLDEIRKNSADAMVSLSPKAEQDIFNSDGINFRALSASTASGLSESAMIIVPSLLAGVATGGGATMAEIASATTAGAAGVIDMFGSAYEQGRQRGLTHEQAQTFGATVMPIGALMGFPAGSLLNKVMQPFAKAFTTEMVENVVEKGLTNEAFADVQKKATNGALDFLKERGGRYVKAAAKEGAIMGGTMGAMTALDQVAEKYYANNSGNQDKFKDVLSKTPLEEVKDIFKAAGSGAIIGGIFAAPELFRPGQIQSIYGYVDKAAMDPAKMDNLKGYIGEVAKQNNYTSETTAEVLAKVDDMAKVATTYGKYVPSAEGRFQVYKLLQDRKLTEGQIGQIPEQLKAIGEELKDNPEMLKQKTETFGEVQKLLEDKQKLIDGFMGKIGTDKKPVEYKDYAEAANKLNGDIAGKLKEIYPDAEGKVEPTAQEAPQPEAKVNDVVEKTGETVPEPKTLTDLLDVPGVKYVGMEGMFNIDENGTLRFIRAEDGKEYPFDKVTAESLLKEPLDGIASVIDGYDKELYAQKVKGQEAPEVKPETEQTPAQDESNITVGEVLDKPVTYKGQKAKLFLDGKTLVASIDGTNREYEIGNIDEVRDHPMKDYGIEHQESLVKPLEDGIEVRGKKYVNKYSDPTAAINYDEDGNIVSVNLETENGDKRAFKGDVAEDIAYQITLQHIEKRPNGTAELEDFINSDESARKQIDDKRNEIVAEKGATTNNEVVPRKKAARKVRQENRTKRNARIKAEEDLKKAQKITPDEEVKTKLEAENDAIHTDIDNPDSKEEEDLLNGIGTRLENEGSLGKGQDTTDNKTTVSDSTGQDSGEVVGQSEQDKTGTSEGTQDKSASTEQGQRKTTSENTGSVEKVAKVKLEQSEVKAGTADVGDYKIQMEAIQMPDGEDGMKVSIEKPDGTKVDAGKHYTEDVAGEVNKKLRGFDLAKTEKKAKPIEVNDSKGAEPSDIGKSVAFDFAGDEVKGVIESIDSNGNYKVKQKEGAMHTVNPDGVRFQSEEPLKDGTTTVIRATDSPHTVEVKIKKKAKESNAKAEEKGITLSEQKADLVGKMERAEEILTGKDRPAIEQGNKAKVFTKIYEDEITPEHIAELEKLGVKIGTNPKTTEKQLEFQIKGDGEVRVGIENLNMTVEMTKKEFPEGEYKVRVKTGAGTGGSLKPTGNYDTLAKAKESLQSAKDNLETAKKTEGKKGLVETYEKQLKLEQSAYDNIVGQYESAKEKIAEVEKRIKAGKIESQYDVQDMLSLTKLKSDVAKYEGKEPPTDKPDYALAEKVLKKELAKAESKYEEATKDHRKKDGNLKSSLSEGVKRNIGWAEREIDGLKKDLVDVRRAMMDADARFQKESTSTGKPIEPSTAKFFQKVVGKAFPGIKSAILDAAEFVKKHGDKVIAAVNRDGTIDINAAKVTNETQVHEMGHIWTSWAKKFAPEIYKQGLKLAEGETELLARIKEAYPELKGDALHEEAMVTAIGQEGGKLAEGLKEPVTLTDKMKDWVSSMWNKLTTYVKNKLGVKDNRFDGLKDMGFNDFTAKVAKELISGKEISGLTSEEIAGIEKDGISRYQVAPVSNDTYMKATPGQQTVTVSPGGGGLTNKMNVQEALDIIGKDPTVTDAHIRDIAAHYSAKIHELDKMVNRNSKGDVAITAGMDGVRKLAEMTGTKPFNDAIKEIADEAKRSGKPKDFDSSNLSKKARAVYGAIGQFEAIYDYRKEVDGHLFTGVSEISHDAPGDQKKTAGAVEKTNKVYDKFRGKNPLQQKIFDGLRHYVTLASHLPLQVKMLSGGESPLWNSWKRSMQFAPGKEFRIKQNANDLLKPLLKVFGNGSNFISGSNVRFLGKPLSNLEGVNWKDFTKESLNPDVKVTQGELLTMYLTMRDPRVREAAFGKDVVGIGEGAKSGVESFWLEEHKGERDGTQVDINEKTWNELQKYFGPHEKLINDTYGKAMDYTHSEEDPVFKTLNGINLAKLQPDANGNNVYFPLIYGKGKDAIQDFSRNSRAIGDVSSHKLRSPTDEKLHYGGDAFQIMNTRINTSADYAGFAVPIKNGDTMMGYARPYMENNGMKKDLEYWNKWKETHSNGTGNMSDLEKTLYRGFTISAIGLNPFVNIKHLTTLPLATNVIRSKYLLSAIGELPKTYGNITKNYDVLKGDKKDWSPTIQRMMKSDFANLRIFGNTSELQAMLDGGGTVKVKSPFTDEMVEFKGKDALTDLKTWETSFGSVVWNAAEKMVAEESPHLKEGTPEHFNKVEELYMDAIVGAQPSFDDVHRSFISKGGFAKERGALNRALTIFSGQPVAQFNLFADRMISYMNNPSEANRNQFGKAFMNVFVMNALVIGTIDTLRQQAIGTQKQKQDGEWLANIEKSTYSSLPILAPLINTVVEKASGIPSAQLQYVALQTVNDGGTMLAHAVTGKEDKAINEMWNFGAKVIGLPSAPIRAVKSIAQ